VAGVKSRTVITVDEHFAEWGASAERHIFEALTAAVEPMVAAAQAAEVPENTGALRGSIAALPPIATERGYEGGIGAGDYKANWYEQGTGARRSRRIKHAGSKRSAGLREQKRKQLKAEGSTVGVKAYHYLRKGLRAGTPLAFHLIGEAVKKASA